MSSSTAPNNVIKLGGDLTFATAKSQCDSIRKFIVNHHTNDIVVDLAGVQHSDSAGVALLIEVLRIAAEAHKTITFQQLPAQMQAVVKFCNLSAFIQNHNGI